MNLLDHALAWHLRGYVPLPLRTDGSKAPAVPTWREYQHSPPDTAAVLELFKAGTDGIGLLTGACSGNLEMLELEGRAITEGMLPRLLTAFDDHDQRALWDRVAGGYVELTPSSGLHYYYRVDGPAARNTKLARRPATEAELGQDPAKAKVLIETRGEGGFTVIAPSAGASHPTGKAWTVLAGGMDTIPTLTVEDRDTLHAIANTLDAMPEVQWSGQASTPSGEAGGRPGDDYNARASWDGLLIPRGWQKVRSFGRNRTGWVRPGKNPHAGISATTGGAADGVDRLFVFTTSTEFEAETPYTKFAALALLEHGGDFAAAARRLAAEGYGAGVEPASTLTLAAPTTAAAEPPASEQPDAKVIAFPTAQPATHGSAALQVAEPVAAHVELNDAGNADAMARRHSTRLRYVPARAQWLLWQGTHWHPCTDNGEATQAARDTLRSLPTGTDAARNHRGKSLSRRGIEATVALASKHEDLRLDAEKLDADPWILNTPSGVVDLRTGQLRPVSPDDLCTRITSAEYHPGEPAPRWHTFLGETFNGDQEMIAYLQRLVGYSACGAVTHHVLPFASGPGGNGKGVALGVLTKVLGTYASTTPAGFLMAGRHDESATARLSGLRMVLSSENNQSAKFDEAKVKLLTGGDQLTSRFLFGQYFTFTPTHTLWLMANHQPRVEAGGESFWRRLRILPFTHKPERVIEDLDAQLLANEAPGILDWIVQGAVAVLGGGMQEPDSVMAATRTYAEEEDALARFVADRLHLGMGRENTADVRAAYLKWCRAEGENEISPQAFGRELRARWGINTIRSHGKRYYSGAVLTVDADEPEPAGHWSDR